MFEEVCDPLGLIGDGVECLLQAAVQGLEEVEDFGGFGVRDVGRAGACPSSAGGHTAYAPAGTASSATAAFGGFCTVSRFPDHANLLQDLLHLIHDQNDDDGLHNPVTGPFAKSLDGLPSLAGALREPLPRPGGFLSSRLLEPGLSARLSE